MADITAAIRDHLEADSTITDIVGTRIRRTIALTSDALPYIVITEVDDRPEQHIGGGSGKSIADVRISCYSTARYLVRILSTLVFESLNGRAKGAMGDDSLVVDSIVMDNRRALDTDPTDGSQDSKFKDVCEFAVGYTQNETP